MVGRGRGTEPLVFRISGAGSREPVRSTLMCHMMMTSWPLGCGPVTLICVVAVNPPEQKLRNGPTFTGNIYTSPAEFLRRLKSGELNCGSCFQTWTTSIWFLSKTDWRLRGGSTGRWCVSLPAWSCSLSCHSGWIMMHIWCHQGMVVSKEELRRTFLQPEETGPPQQGEETDGFRHPDLLGETSVVTFYWRSLKDFRCWQFKRLKVEMMPLTTKMKRFLMAILPSLSEKWTPYYQVKRSRFLTHICGESLSCVRTALDLLCLQKVRKMSWIMKIWWSCEW